MPTTNTIQAELKNVKIARHLSEETTAFSATLYVDGKKTANVQNHGRGGCNSYHVLDKDRWESLETYVETLPPQQDEELGEFSMDTDLFVDELLIKWEQDTQFKRWCRKDVVYRLKGDKKGQWRLVPHRNDVAKAIEWVKNEHGNDIEEIVNERFS